ncbi:TonB-dependent siderophore receptor [Steroidobacter flavus]|uniref:TonB-dependent siderophore receptor n=1 Tax=Steroidobacter flavus TaxID=1842136 RepID=A0ABV8SP84_9GAMM
MLRESVLLLALAAPVLASGDTTSETTAERNRSFDFDIGSQPLPRTITQIASLTGLQVLYDSQGTMQIVAPAVKGRFTADQALKAALEGSGFSYRYTSAGVVTLERARKDSVRVIGPVQVEGAEQPRLTAAGNGMSGVNGSTDPTATEGTGSYTTGAITVGSKTAAAMKDIPQSVSVITSEQIKDQNLFTMEEALERAPGITFSKGLEYQNHIYSRGYEVSGFMIDGTLVAGLYNLGAYGGIDLSQYDHVEIVRGPDGLFSSMGSPAGTINLSRKKPLDHAQALLDLSATGVGGHRVMADLSSPLGFAGLKGRLVVMSEENKYFYDDAEDEGTTLYAVIEANPVPNSAVRVGVSETETEGKLWYGGLPRFSNGDDIGFARDTSFVAPWNHEEASNTEYFVNGEYAFDLDWLANSQWLLKASYSRLRSDAEFKYAFVGGRINPVTLQGLRANGYRSKWGHTAISKDVNLSGSFELWGGRKLELLLGANRADSLMNDGQKVYVDGAAHPIDLFNFDPGSVPEPGDDELILYYQLLSGKGRHEAQYFKASVEFTSSLSATVGLNRSSSDSRTWINYPAIPQFGLVEERNDRSVNRFNQNVPIPYYALTYEIAPWVTTHLSYTDIYSSSTVLRDRNQKALDPTHSDQWELGFKFSLRGGRLTAGISSYLISERGFYSLDESVEPRSFPDGGGCCFFFNDQEKQSRGYDVEVVGEVLDGLQLTASYTFSHLENKTGYNTETGQTFNTRPPNQLFKLWTTYAPPSLEKWSFGFGANGQSKYYTKGSIPTDTNPITGAPIPPYIPYEFTVKPYVILDGSLEYQLTEKFAVRLNIDNLLDKTYWEAIGGVGSGNLYGAPRSYVLSVRGAW